MQNSRAFETVCDGLTEHTRLESIAARGTVRIALKQAGLEASTVTPDQIAVVLERLMPQELESRGVNDAAQICRALVDQVRSLAGNDVEEDSPEKVFGRLGAT